jgi:hypothetical protein
MSLRVCQLSAVERDWFSILGNNVWLVSMWMVNFLLKSGYANMASHTMTHLAIAKAALCLGPHSHLTFSEVRLASGASVWERRNHMSR